MFFETQSEHRLSRFRTCWKNEILRGSLNILPVQSIFQTIGKTNTLGYQNAEKTRYLLTKTIKANNFYHISYQKHLRSKSLSNCDNYYVFFKKIGKKLKICRTLFCRSFPHFHLLKIFKTTCQTDNFPRIIL